MKGAVTDILTYVYVMPTFYSTSIFCKSKLEYLNLSSTGSACGLFEMINPL